MNSFRIIFIVFIINFLNLLIYQKLFTSVIICSIINIYFLSRYQTNQKQINKITLIELSSWIINTYLVLINNFNLWFLALNNLLWLLTSIKLIESKNDIKTRNIILLLFLSIGTGALFNITLISNFVNLICIALLIYSLLLINNFKSENFIKQILVLISFIPLTFFFYIFIPKAKPWLNINSQTLAKTGINNKLRPGDISSLAKESDLVGRIFFDNELPNNEERYWRVFVLDQFKDNTWSSNSKENINFKLNNNLVASIQNNINNIKAETWILEPNYIRERPWSGYGYPVDRNLRISNKGKLIGEKDLKKRKEYQISGIKNSWRLVSPNNRKNNIDKSYNKRAYALGKKWAKESINQEAIIYKAEKFFKEGGYEYSMNPGLMNKNAPYDDFLFNKKTGFCEHFAGSFTLLMNHANIPARVVVGYQGGKELENFEDKNYLLIDNSYVHAWSEVWIKGKGWIRIDPTLWIAPERIQDTLILKENKFILQKLVQNFKFELFNNLSLLEIRFNSLIRSLSFNNKILTFSGNIILNRIVSIIIFTLILSVTIIFLLLDKTNKNNIIKKNMNIYLYFISKYSFKIYEAETLISISYRLTERYPNIANQINKIQVLYNSYKFRKYYTNRKKYFSLFIKLLYLEIFVLIYIGLGKLKPSYKKITFNKKS